MSRLGRDVLWLAATATLSCIGGVRPVPNVAVADARVGTTLPWPEGPSCQPWYANPADGLLEAPLAPADAPRDRGADRRVGKVDPGALHGRLADGQLRLRLAKGRRRVVVVLLPDRATRGQLLEPRLPRTQGRKTGLRHGNRRRGLVVSRLVGRGIDPV